MKYINIKNLDKYNPGYKDRHLIWCKVYFSMLNTSYEMTVLDDIDKWRLIALIMIELQTKKRIPYDTNYLNKKITNNKRPISKTIEKLQMLEFIDVTENGGNRNNINTHNIIEYNIIEENRIDKKAQKTKFLEFVYLTNNEHKKLIERFGQAKTKNFIERLNNYIGSKGKKYSSHYHTILNWANNDAVKSGEIVMTKHQKSTMLQLEQMRKDGYE